MADYCGGTKGKWRCIEGVSGKTETDRCEESMMNAKKITIRMIGKSMLVLQLFFAIVLLIAIAKCGVLPSRYLGIIGGILFVFVGIAFGLQRIQNKAYSIGIILCVLMIFIQIMGIVYAIKVGNLMTDVGGATFKTDNMIVVVKKENKAETLEDAAAYRFGIQTSVDQENTQKMLSKINDTLKREVKVEQYTFVQDLADALLQGRVDAIIYNQALDGIISNSNEKYADQTRILYQYGINTPLEKETADVTEPFNVYISGIDVDGSIITNSRSDVNIIMTINPNTKKILLTTTPRDYYVQIPNISGEQKDKLTHAGIYGVDTSIKTLEQLYGIDISYYVRVNFTSLVKIVDALGGVDVNSDYEFTTLHGGYHIVKGVNHLDGEQALGFSRERYSFEDGDNQRGKNQQKVLIAILKKAMSPAVLKNANELITGVEESLQTNMTHEEMAKFISMQLSDATMWTFETQAAKGNGDNQACFSAGEQLLYVMWPDETSVQNISNKIIEVLNEK